MFESPRRFTVLLIALVCCTGSENATADGAGDTSVVSPAQVPAYEPSLRSEHVAGTWRGVTLSADGKRELGNWTIVQTAGTGAFLVFEERRDTVSYQVRFDADSMVATSETYSSSGAPRGRKVRFPAIGRLRHDTLAGSLTLLHPVLPDSIFQRLRFRATRAR